MRGRDAIAVALRHPDGRIVWSAEPLAAGFRGTRWAKLPLVRGLVVLYETLVIGTRWLVRSAGVAAADELPAGTTADGRTADAADLGAGSVALMLGVTLVIGVGLFFFLPLVVARLVAGGQPGIVERVVEGIVQVVIFLGYLSIIGRTQDVRRTFQYHGAEHMTIHALEAGDPLTVEAVRTYPTAHPRCGTEFLVVVILVSIITFSLVGRQPLPLMILSRVILVPVIAAISYELLRFGARHRGNRLVRAVFEPGIWVQKITTKQPTDDMIEVAIVSMEQALEADGEAIPAGSGTLARSPLLLAGAGTGSRTEGTPGTAEPGTPQPPAAPGTEA